MTTLSSLLMVDCSVVIKWKIASEPHSAQARELLLDWQAQAIDVCAPDQLRGEVMSAFLKAFRRGRLTRQEALDSIEELLTLPIHYFKTTKRVVIAAFEIAEQHNQRSYDCIYVALAGRKKVDFWTGDERLFNALHGSYPFVRWIADYHRMRP
jgi:predicted nucleic acid-binding protein